MVDYLPIVNHGRPLLQSSLNFNLKKFIVLFSIKRTKSIGGKKWDKGSENFQREREREREREKIIIYISVMVDKGSISELRLFIDKFWGQIVKGWCKKILSGFIYVFAKKLFCWGWW